MADEADMAQEQLDASIADNIRAIVNAPRLRPKGICYACLAPVQSSGQLYCDDLCAEDHAYVQRRQAANKRIED